MTFESLSLLFGRTESSRPYISGQVAHTMASEVISLLHGLLASSTSDTAKIWASAVQGVLCEALDSVPDLIKALEAEAGASQTHDQVLTEDSEPKEDEQLSTEHEWFFKARNVVAALSALGGFRQNVHAGCTVKVLVSKQIVCKRYLTIFCFFICEELFDENCKKKRKESMTSETLKDTDNDLKASLSKDGGVFERPGKSVFRLSGKEFSRKLSIEPLL